MLSPDLGIFCFFYLLTSMLVWWFERFHVPRAPGIYMSMLGKKNMGAPWGLTERGSWFPHWTPEALLVFAAPG